MNIYTLFLNFVKNVKIKFRQNNDKIDHKNGKPEKRITENHINPLKIKDFFYFRKLSNLHKNKNEKNLISDNEHIIKQTRYCIFMFITL